VFLIKKIPVEVIHNGICNVTFVN